VSVPQQVPRLGIVFAVAITVLIGARSILVPASFGKYGHYRAAAVDSIAARPVKYAGHQECEACHDDIAGRRAHGNHRSVACEVCHGPGEAHVLAPGDVTPPAPRDRGFCPRCHAYNPSRPTGFPQIDPVAHNPLKPCISCHDPHAPVPPVVPEECSACHGQIARVKALSHHANLPCVTCHDVPRQHKISPHAVRPTKPTERAFCGRCHDPSAPRRGIGAGAPRIDLATHNPRYLCWQCHYPHFPETQ
jgi:ribosomal protein S27AE